MSVEKILFDLSDRTAVVTGGLGMLGTQYVRSLEAFGARVAVLDVLEMASDHSLHDLVEKGSVRSYVADIGARSEVERVAESIRRDFGIPSILVTTRLVIFRQKRVPGVILNRIRLTSGMR